VSEEPLRLKKRCASEELLRRKNWCVGKTAASEELLCPDSHGVEHSAITTAQAPVGQGKPVETRH
jgi:hypothetical protein